MAKKEIYELDILQQEKDENLPYWLDHTEKRADKAAQDAVRARHRDRWVKQQQAKADAARRERLQK